MYSPWECNVTSQVPENEKNTLCSRIQNDCNNSCIPLDTQPRLPNPAYNPACDDIVLMCVPISIANPAYNAANLCDYSNICNRSGEVAIENVARDYLKKEIDNYIKNVSATFDIDKIRANMDSVGCLKVSPSNNTKALQLSCIDSVIASVINNADYQKDPNAGCNGSLGVLTLAQAMSCSNSGGSDVTTNEIDNGPLNSTDNAGNTVSKTDGPKVEISFAATSFQPGSIVTASAVPGFFNNTSDIKNLYFTWYLKREGCENNLNVDSDSDLGKKCDLDKSGKITENDWKIAAAQIMVKGVFDKADANYNVTGFSDSAAGYEAIPSIKNDWTGNNNKDDATRCYVKENTSGNFYELADLDHSQFDACPSGYSRACVANVSIGSCSVLNSFGATVAQPMGSSACVASWIASDPITTEKQECLVKNKADLANFVTSAACLDENQTAICLKNGNSVNFFPENPSSTKLAKGAIFPTSFVDNDMCRLIFNENTAVPAVPAFLSTTNSVYSGIQNQNCATIKEGMTNKITGNTALNPACSFKKDSSKCKHLFPELGNEKIGDGKFTLAEKEKWGANPNVVSTNGSGKPDEQVIAGLGEDKFKWMYSSGDMLGVAVEGDSSFSSDHQDSSFKRMWAFSNGLCKKLDSLDTKDDNLGFYTEGDGLGKRGFMTTDFDLNKCFEGGLIDPVENSSLNLKVNLTTSPKNPVNDEDSNGDTLTISSLASNVQETNGISYDWSVQKISDGSTSPTDMTQWENITSKLITNGSFAATDVVGTGNKNLNIKLNIPKTISNVGSDAYFYLRIRVKVTASAADNGGVVYGETIVKIKQQQNKMRAYYVKADNTGNLSLGDNAICETSGGKISSTCYVARNTIVGAEIPIAGNMLASTPLTWTINGVDISCDATVSSTQCGVNKKNVLFFPILGNPGESVDIEATGIGLDKQVINLSRHFVIGSPQLQLVASDSLCSPQCLADPGATACQKYVGAYLDLAGGNKVSDCSADVWETNTGKTVTLSGMTGETGLTWVIDGETVPEYTNQPSVELPITKISGDSYNIVLSTHISPEDAKNKNNIRLALNKNWGVSVANSVDEIAEEQSATIDLNVVENLNTNITEKKNNIFGASLITHLPEQLLFLLRISLMSILVFFFTALLFAFMPETLFAREEK